MTDRHGADLLPTVSRCLGCGVGPRAYSGRWCGPCFREANGIVFAPVLEVLEVPEVPAVVAAPRHRSPGRSVVERTAYRRRVLGMSGASPIEVDAAWAARTPPAKPKPPLRVAGPPRYCEWPGCGERHARHRACHRDARRLLTMARVGTDPATWPEAWEEHLADLGSLAAWNGAAHAGLAKRTQRPALTLRQWRALVGK